MDKHTLHSKLIGLEIPEISFSVNGIKDGEAMCLVEQDDTWQVVYNSRGRIYVIDEFPSEEQACQFMYDELKREYKRK
ncbi:MAG: hypothetical protein O2809_09695 [Proteobacteria bacterium]|nr:hypothetical protein [Pseudomonadota bacterium]